MTVWDRKIVSTQRMKVMCGNFTIKVSMLLKTPGLEGLSLVILTLPDRYCSTADFHKNVLEYAVIYYDCGED